MSFLSFIPSVEKQTTTNFWVNVTDLSTIHCLLTLFLPSLLRRSAGTKSSDKRSSSTKEDKSHVSTSLQDKVFDTLNVCDLIWSVEMECFCSVGEPAKTNLPARGAAAQWNAAERWVGAEMQVWNKPLSYVHSHFPKYRLRQILGLKEKNEDLNFLIHDGKMSLLVWLKTCCKNVEPDEKRIDELQTLKKVLFRGRIHDIYKQEKLEWHLITTWSQGVLCPLVPLWFYEETGVFHETIFTRFYRLQLHCFIPVRDIQSVYLFIYSSCCP